MLIVNPVAGRGLTKYSLGAIVAELCSCGHHVTVYFSGAKMPDELVEQFAHNYDLIVCVGGDGTLSNVVTGLLRSANNIPIGYIPSGTANDISTSLSIPKTPQDAVNTVITGSPMDLDIGLFEEKYFTYIAAFGAFTSVSYTTPQNIKRSLGHFAYVLSGIAEVPTIKPHKLTVVYDGNTISGDFIFGAVVNSTSVAGFLKLDPSRVDLSDGLFEIVLVRQPVDPASFIDLLSSLATQSYDGDNFLLLHGSEVRFTFEEDVAWTVDGEDGGLHKEVHISNSHKAVRVIV